MLHAQEFDVVHAGICRYVANYVSGLQGADKKYLQVSSCCKHYFAYDLGEFRVALGNELANSTTSLTPIAILGGTSYASLSITVLMCLLVCVCRELGRSHAGLFRRDCITSG